MKQTPNLPFAERYKAILEAFGLLPADLAKRMNEPIAKFYKYQNGVEPRPAFILRMVKALQGLSEDYALRGIGEIKLSPQAVTAPYTPPSSPVPVSMNAQDMEELNRLRTESVIDKALIEELRRQLLDLKKEKREVDREWREVIVKEGFPESDSHNHRFQQLIRESYRVEGLVRYDAKGDDNVRPMYRPAARFILNSRMPIRRIA